MDNLEVGRLEVLDSRLWLVFLESMSSWRDGLGMLLGPEVLDMSMSCWAMYMLGDDYIGILGGLLSFLHGEFWCMASACLGPRRLVIYELAKQNGYQDQSKPGEIPYVIQTQGWVIFFNTCLVRSHQRQIGASIRPRINTPQCMYNHLRQKCSYPLPLVSSCMIYTFFVLDATRAI